MTKKIYILTTLLLLVFTASMKAANDPTAPGTAISIPTATGNYFNCNYATMSNCNVDNNEGTTVGSTHNGSTFVFNLTNDKAQDYVLSFLSGANNLTATISATLTNEAGYNEKKLFDVSNTKSWTPSEGHIALFDAVPTGNLTLTFKVESTTASYAGNYGNIALASTDSYDKAPGTLALTNGTYSGSMRLENNNANVGWIKNGDMASHPFICTTAGVYSLGLNISYFGNACQMTCAVVDVESGETEATTTTTITSKLGETSIVLGGELTSGLKQLKIAFASESTGFLVNYQDLSLTRVGDHFAKISAVAISGIESSEADDCDWFFQLPAAYATTTTFSVTPAYGTVAATAEGINITDNGDGTFTLPTPAPGTTTLVTLTLTPASGAFSSKTTYTLKLFRIGEISLTDATVDGISIGEELLSTLNAQLSAEYQNTYTAMPTVKVQCIDGNWFEPTGDPVVADNKATYSFHITMAGKEKDYTLVVDGIHIYNKVEGDKTVELKYTSSADNVWTNGLYSLSPIGDGWPNSGFKMASKNNPFTLTVPVDVKVKQFIIHEFSDNYADGSLKSITSEGMTAYIPAKHDFVKGSSYTLIVNLEGHQAGQPIQFAFEGGSQTTGWFELTTEAVAVTVPPVLKSQSVTSTTSKNHCVVTLAFDREMADATATIGGQTVKAEGGSAVLYFRVWNLDYDTKYTFTVAADGAKDTHGNGNIEAITIPITVGSKPAVEQKAYDYVVSTADELKDAIAAIDATNTSAAAERKVIFLKNGTYDLGSTGTSTVQWVNAHNISFIGESKDGVIICGTSSDISNPVLNIRNGSGQYMQDLTVRNLTDFDKQKRVGVSVAIYGGNHAVFKNVAMQAQQDTQVTGESGYYIDCDFYGAVDFLCGGGDHFYDHCNFFLTNGGYITAPSTSPANKWGYVMQHCTINGYEGSYTYNGFDDKGKANFTLGRPWQGEPRNYWLNTTMNILPAADGWSGMGKLATHFYEYNSVDKNGNAVDVSGRKNPTTSTNTYDPFLADDEAQLFTVENVLGGTDSWLPTEETIETAAPVVSVDDEKVLSWEAVDDARCYVILKDGQYVANTISTSWQAPENGIYSVRSANKNGGLCGTSEEVEVKDATGIMEVSGSMIQVSGAERYNLNGQRVNASHKGLVIVGRRKVINK